MQAIGDFIAKSFRHNLNKKMVTVHHVCLRLRSESVFLAISSLRQARVARKLALEIEKHSLRAALQDCPEQLLYLFYFQ